MQLIPAVSSLMAGPSLILGGGRYANKLIVFRDLSKRLKLTLVFFYAGYVLTYLLYLFCC